MRLSKNIIFGLGLVFLGFTPIAHAQNIQNPNYLNAKTGFAPLAKKLLPSVVGVSSYNPTRINTSRFVSNKNAPISTGSGFIYNASGFIITNNHVVESGTSFTITLQNGQTYPANIIGRDEETDLAVLKINQTNGLVPLPIGNSDSMEIGDWAIAIGSPYGLGNSFSVGVISGRNRDLQSGRFDDFLQTDAAINSGNSGGPLLNEKGELIGVNTAIVANSRGGGSVGIGFAIPSNLVRKVANDIIKNGYVVRGYAGFRARACSPNECNGVVISAIAENGPAAKAGMRVNDTYFQAGSVNITDPRHLARIVSNSPIGSHLRIDGFRGQKRIFANLEIAKPPSLNATLPNVGIESVKVAGLNLRPLNPQEKAKFGNEGNIIIAGVDEYSTANGIFKAGDIILEIAGTKINNPQQARNIIETQKKARGFVFLRIKRNNIAQTKMLR